MKATINGHEVEGTPDEIAALMMILKMEEPKTGTTEPFPPGYGPGSIKYEKNNQQQYQQSIWSQDYTTNAEFNATLQAQINNVNAMHAESEDAKQCIMGMGDVIGQKQSE